MNTIDIKDCLAREGRYIEFKVMVPPQTSHYMKTIVAFANTKGGKLIFGVQDQQPRVVGINEAEIDSLVDGIASAIFEMVKPQINPEIYVANVEGKYLIVVEVKEEVNPPYYLVKEGPSHGVYLRLGATTRHASVEQIEELRTHNKALSWDKLPCPDCLMQEEDLQQFCTKLTDYRLHRIPSSENLSPIGKADLLDWGVLIKKDHEIIPTKAYALLAGKNFEFAKIQCARFRGNNHIAFTDRKEFSGPLHEQIEQAYGFVCDHVNQGGEIEGLFMKDLPEVPLDAVREMIINAVGHRNYSYASCIKVFVFDDRIEVTSPGSFCFNQTMEKALQGESMARNRIIFKVLRNIGVAEGWGTGLQRIFELAKEYHLPTPKFEEIEDLLRITLFRQKGKYNQRNPSNSPQQLISTNNSAKANSPFRNAKAKTAAKTKTTRKMKIKLPLNPNAEKILDAIQNDQFVTIKELANIINISTRAVEKNLQKLKAQKRLVRQGGDFGGKWKVK